MIQGVNCILLAVIFLGLPAVAGEQFWKWQVSSVPLARRLIFLGLTLAVVGNAGIALRLVKGRKERRLCWEWAGIFIGLLLVQYVYVRGCFNFNWLRQALLWLQNHI